MTKSFFTLFSRLCSEPDTCSLPGRQRALAGVSREVTSKFLKELEGEGVWLFNYLKIIAFLTLSMIINIYFPGARAASEG